LEPFMGCSDAESLAVDWAKRKSRAIKRVDTILASTGLTMGAVMAQTLSLKLDDIERIDRMIAIAEARRNVVLREIDRHRESLSQNPRRSMQQVEDKLRVIENESVPWKNAQ
jgi:esterase/lipase